MTYNVYYTESNNIVAIYPSNSNPIPSSFANLPLVTCSTAGMLLINQSPPNTYTVVNGVITPTLGV